MLTPEENKLINELRVGLQMKMKNVFNKSPKTLKDHAKDIGINVNTMTRLLRTNDLIHPYTLSKVMVWLEKNKEDFGPMETMYLNDLYAKAERSTGAKNESPKTV